MCRSVRKCIFILGFASSVVLDAWVLKQFGYYWKHFNSLEWNFDKHAYICVQFFRIMWWHSTILFNNFCICMNVLESMIYCSVFWFDLNIIFLFLLSFLCSRIWFGTRGSSCQAPLFCCFHATVVAAVLFGIGYKNNHGELLSFLCSPLLVVGLSLSWSWSHDYGGHSAFMAIVPCVCQVRLL